MRVEVGTNVLVVFIASVLQTSGLNLVRELLA